MTMHQHELLTDQPLGTLEPVAHFHGAMSTGVTVSHQGRIFVNFPQWGDDVQFAVAELRDGEPVACPNEAFNQPDPDDPAAALVSVQRVVTDGYLYVTANQLHRLVRYHGGQDLRRKPYTLFRVRIDAQPVLLR